MARAETPDLQYYIRRHENCQIAFCHVAACDSMKLIDLVIAARTDQRTIRILRDTLKTALAHVVELREAWKSGALHDRDGRGGIRSNRNADVEFSIHSALQDTDKKTGEPACESAQASVT